MFTNDDISEFMKNIPCLRIEDTKQYILQMFKNFLYVESETDCAYQWDMKEKYFVFSQEMTAPPSFSWDTDTLLFKKNDTGDKTLRYIRNMLEPFREVLKNVIPSVNEEDVYSHLMTRGIEREIIQICSKENIPQFDRNDSGFVATNDGNVLSFRTLESRRRTYKDLHTYIM